MLIENNTLKKIDQEDVIDGVFVAPDDVLYIGSHINGNTVVKMILPNVVEIDHCFMEYNRSLKHLVIPKVERIGSYFLYRNDKLEHLEIPKVEIIGRDFLFNNTALENLDIPNIRQIGFSFLFYNTIFKYTPKIVKALKGNLVIGNKVVDKKDFIRKLNINKII